MDQYQQYIHKSRYARFLPEKNRRESWEETVDRYLNFWDDQGINLKKSEKKELKEAIQSLNVMPSMRCMMTAGPALDRDHCAAFNCSFLPIDHPRSFDELMYILLCGTGVGFSVEQHNIDKLPEIADEFHDTDSTVVVSDSKIGWASAFRELVSLLYAGKVPKCDLTRIRPAGARLKTFGGRASGPAPLADLFNFTVDLFKNAAGRKLNSLECHDLACKIADIVVVGGVRRCLPTGTMIQLANGNKPIQDVNVGDVISCLGKQAKVKEKVFSGKQKTLKIKCEGGEALKADLVCTPNHRVAVFNYDSSEIEFKQSKHLTTDDYMIYDLSYLNNENDNMMVPYKIETIEDYEELDTYDLEIEDIHMFTADGLVVHNSALISLSNVNDQKLSSAKAGQWWVDNPQRALANNSAVYNEKPDFETFFKEMLSLYTSKSGERGIFSRSAAKNVVKRNGRRDPEHVWGTNPSLRKGTKVWTTNGFFPIEQLENKEFFVKNLNGKISPAKCWLSGNDKQLYKIVLNDGHEYYCTAEHKWPVWNNTKFIKKTTLELTSGDILPKNPDEKIKIKSIEKTDLFEDVWDISVQDDTHCFQLDHCITGNCSEILLRPYEKCNLTEVIIRSDDDKETLKEKVKIATIFGTLQSSLTNFRYLRKIWKKNAEEEALLGVSLTGIMDNKLMYDDKNLPDLLEELRNVAIETNKKWAERIGVNPSTAVTCVKPSGSISQLADTASGIHPRFSKYYIRTVRADKKDPLATAMIEAGFPHEEDITNPSNWVFSFPKKSPDEAVLTNDIGTLGQLKLWKIYQDHWCEHKPSMTCYYTDDSFFDICQWVWNNFDTISGISFLPYSEHSYQQAPYQEIDKETYDKLLEKMPKDFDWDSIIEGDDNTEALQTLACSSGVCEI